ncbi:choice-of-anchor tandem repeat GloVer-containing protein [Yeosuana marina]|uniref:choice-of-anchor tandem repeat GloVer-containing protein n=1 Tax=Yeosuana marina TaxID=1565536 RepID=UPI0030EC7ED6
MKLKLHFILLALLIFSFTKAQTKMFYGMTNSGGTNNLGVIFKTDANGDNLTVVYNFSGSDGSRPDNGKLCYANGLLYGTTGKGGSNNMGVLFSYNPNTETYTKLHDFDGLNSGRNPYSNVIIASDGKLYGTTLYGGTNDFGTLFEYNIATNTLTKKLDFDGTNMGENIYGNVIEATNGNLYGVTNRGGIYDWGVLYEYNYTTEMYSKLIDFDDTTIGRLPQILLEVENNILYGTASGGGTNGSGTIFEYNITTNTFTKKFDFEDSSSGSSPYLSLIKASNGKLYGFTRNGGANNYGVFYEYNILLESFNKRLDFSSETGFSPTGNLLEASNGNLYGLTFYGGTNNDGTIFEYNISTNTFSKKLDFDSSNGSNPKGSLIEIEVSNLGNEEFIQSKADVILWPNPVNDMIHVKAKEDVQFHVNIYNLMGQELQSNKKFQNYLQLNMSQLSSGIYILKVTSKNGNTQTIKFIKS